ncbi:Ankyrin repeat protein 1 [Giardia muris]|uniref:Ankyrin repeat protein 1 n=1 Tax=Giardia muris TaxID=5742 RepID=A0A4Z1T7G7_GIAMU|nr:Ankyrin repeat protein 1 [Giardia muris]|eukprot:TNJ28441.1 Ankyrin repeat protein 1 [Giardia muris]
MSTPEDGPSDGLREAWFAAARSGDHDFVAVHLSVLAGARNPDNGGETALMIAADLNDVKLAQILLEAEAGLVNAAGDTALIIAVRKDHVYICRLLVDREAGIQTADGLTPLMVAVCSSSISCFPYMFPALAHMRDKNGNNALDHAVLQKKFSCVLYLLNHNLYSREDIEHTIRLTAGLGTLYTRDILTKHLAMLDTRGSTQSSPEIAKHRAILDKYRILPGTGEPPESTVPVQHKEVQTEVERPVSLRDKRSKPLPGKRITKAIPVDLNTEHVRDATPVRRVLSPLPESTSHSSSSRSLRGVETPSKGSSANADISRLRLEVSDLQKQLTAAREANNRLTSQFQDARSQIRKLHAEKAQLNVKITTLEKALERHVRKEQKRISTAQASPQRPNPDVPRELPDTFFSEYDAAALNDDLKTELQRVRVELQEMQALNLALLTAREGEDSVPGGSPSTNLFALSACSSPVGRSASADPRQALLTSFRLTNREALKRTLRTALDSSSKPLDTRAEPERDADGNTALMRAIYADDADAVEKHIWQAGQTNTDGDTALMLAGRLNRYQLILLFAEKEAGIRRHDGETALTLALRNEQYEAAAVLRQYEGKKFDDLQLEHTIAVDPPPIRRSELMEAAKEDDIVKVWSLIELQAGLRDEHGLTALMYAARNDAIESLIILQRLEARMRDREGCTALMHAVKTRRYDCIKLLRREEQGLQDDRGWTALMYGASEDDSEAILLLLEEAGMRSCGSGCTALQIAILVGAVGCVRILAPREIGISDDKGQTVWDWCTRAEAQLDPLVHIEIRRILKSCTKKE